MSEQNESYVTKTNLIKDLAQNTGTSQKDAALFLNSLETVLKYYIEKNMNVKVPSFFSLETKTLPAKKGRHPKTGETIEIKARKVTKIKISKKMIK